MSKENPDKSIQTKRSEKMADLEHYFEEEEQDLFDKLGKERYLELFFNPPEFDYDNPVTQRIISNRRGFSG